MSGRLELLASIYYLYSGLRFHFFKDCPDKYRYSLNLWPYKSLNLQTYLVGKTVVLHQHKIARGKHVVFTYICYRKTTGQFQYQLTV